MGLPGSGSLFFIKDQKKFQKNVQDILCLFKKANIGDLQPFFKGHKNGEVGMDPVNWPPESGIKTYGFADPEEIFTNPEHW